MGLGAILACFFGWWGSRNALIVAEERETWKRGEEVRLLGLQGDVKSTSKLGVTWLYEYKLQARYADPSGAQRTADLDFETLWRPVDQTRAPTLRAAPDDPNHPVLSWAIDAGPWRAAVPGLFLGMGLLFAIGEIIVLQQNRGRERLMRACAEDGEEVLLPLVSCSPVHKGTWSLRYEAAPGVFRRQVGDAPLVVVRDAREHVVALRSPRVPEPWIVPEDVSVFDLPPDERDAVLRRCRERG